MISREIWKPVVGFEDYYEVSDRGRIKSLARISPGPHGPQRRKMKMLKLRYNPDGYVTVILFVDGVGASHKVHHLVLKAFKGPCPAGCETRHLNGVPDDNSLTNLVWGTPADNRADMMRHGTRARGSAHGLAKLSETDIPLIREAYVAGASVADLARQYSVTYASIKQIINKRTWTHV